MLLIVLMTTMRQFWHNQTLFLDNLTLVQWYQIDMIDDEPPWYFGFVTTDEQLLISLSYSRHQQRRTGINRELLYLKYCPIWIAKNKDGLPKQCSIAFVTEPANGIGATTNLSASACNWIDRYVAALKKQRDQNNVTWTRNSLKACLTCRPTQDYKMAIVWLINSNLLLKTLVFKAFPWVKNPNRYVDELYVQVIKFNSYSDGISA